jgi:hypothetical protein
MAVLFPFSSVKIEVSIALVILVNLRNYLTVSQNGFLSFATTQIDG